jgi:thioredoxin-like negative regulator of GroEL
MDRRQFIAAMIGTAGIGTIAARSAFALPTTPKIKWHNNLKSAYKVARSQDKPLLILFSATWCTYCHKLIRESLGDKKMVAFVEQQFVPLLLDFDKDKEIAKVLEVESLPCTIVLSPQADLLLQVNGFQKTTEYRETLQTSLDKRDELIQQARATSK